MRKRIILVGAEPSRLRSLPGFREALGDDWEAASAATAAPQAFDVLHRTPVHAVVCDLHLPGASGPQFLDTVMSRYPSVQRYLLADLADKKTMLNCVSTAHQFLAGPCDGARLRAALDRTAQLDLLFANESAKNLLGRMQKLPSPPATYFQIVRELQSPAASLESVGQIVSQDPAITAKLLQLVNSAAFGLQREVADPAEAVMFLGFEMTKSFVLLAHTYSHFDQVSLANFSMDMLWRHSLATARIAQTIACAESVGNQVQEQAFTAGLLHDIAKLLLAANKPEEFNRVLALAREKRVRFWEAEQEMFGTTHAEVGAWLAAIWALPLGIVEALALHHFPVRLVSKGFSPLTAVHVANVFEHVQHQDAGEEAWPDLNYLAELGLDQYLETWAEITGTETSTHQP